MSIIFHSSSIQPTARTAKFIELYFNCTAMHAVEKRQGFADAVEYKQNLDVWLFWNYSAKPYSTNIVTLTMEHRYKNLGVYERRHKK